MAAELTANASHQGRALVPGDHNARQPSATLVMTVTPSVLDRMGFARIRTWVAHAFTIGVLTCFAAPALADALIVDSSGTDVEIGSWLRDGDQLQATNALDLTVLERGNLRVISVPAGVFTYRDPASEVGAPDSARLAMIVSSLLTPEESAFHVGARRGGQQATQTCPEADAVAPQSLADVSDLADRQCDDAARAALRVLIDTARASAPQ